MTFLAVDTSGAYAVIVLAADTGAVIASTVFEGRRTLSKRLLGVIDGLLKENGVAMQDLGAFGVGVGPGSFTGLRVGLTTIRTLAQVTGKPIVGVPTLEAYAYGIAGATVIAVTPSRRGEVYAAVYEAATPARSSPPLPNREGEEFSEPTTEVMGCRIGCPADNAESEIGGEPFAVSPMALRERIQYTWLLVDPFDDVAERPVIVCGEPDAVRSVADVGMVHVEMPWIPPSSLAALTAQRLSGGLLDDFMSLAPLYVVPPAVSTPRDPSVLGSVGTPMEVE